MFSKKCGKALFLVLFVLIVQISVFADIRLPSVIGSKMVLQQKMRTPIWGWAEPGEKVSVKGSCQWFGKSTKANTDGKWMVKIRTPKAGGPYTIAIEGNNKIVLDDVLIGDVWVCSGQSNMQRGLTNAAGGNEEAAQANYPEIRLFRVKLDVADEPKSDCQGEWQKCSPQTARWFSAVGYFFGKQLHKKLDIPIGLVGCYYYGTTAEAWMSREVVESDPDISIALAKHKELLSIYPEEKKKYDAKIKKWEAAVAKAKADGKKRPGKPGAPVGPGDYRTPSGVYNAMLNPIIPYGMRGVIWYQGEANAGQGYQYRKVFPAMIKNWRDDWQQGDFPFFYVQLPPYKYPWIKEPGVAKLREAQLMSLSVPNTGMIVTTDVGDVNDAHPMNKKDVGERLALVALAKSYGKKLVYSGPIYKSMKIEGDKIRLFFEHVGGGLAAEKGKLTHFIIAGRNEQFVNADAVIDENTIVVSSKEVKKPIAVRFAWANAPVPNLFNKAGLPASPFRTDKW